MPRGHSMAPFLAIVALLACPVGAARRSGIVHQEPEGPSYQEWKDKKGNASADADAAVAREQKMAAVNKVISLMETMYDDLFKEAEKENKTYTKFKWFCEDTADQKREAITKGEDEQTRLKALIEELETTLATLKEDIKNLMDDIDTAEKEIKEAKAERADTLKLYTTNSNDLKAALEALEGAIKSVKSSKPSFAQIKGVSSTVRTALLLADALGLKGSEKVAALLQQPSNEVGMEDYKFHSDDIISHLEDLLDKFRKKKIEVDEEEVAEVQKHDLLMQEKTHLIRVKTEELNDKKERKAKTIEDIASNTQQLKTTEAQLAEDKDYLQELLQMCREKKDTYEQRVKIRNDELAMLTQVMEIIKGEVANKTSAATIRFNQRGVSVRLARAVASSDAAVEAMEAEAEGVEAGEGSGFNFMQQGQKKASLLSRMRVASRHAAPADDGRATVEALLRKEGSRLKSTLLTSLAGQISSVGGEDPLAKVKFLIQELIERLLQEANAEENQKGWCDKSMSEAKQRREYSSKKIEELNGEMAELEARRDKLAGELATLAKEIGELEDAKEKAEKIRKEEKAENEATIAEAQAGMDALREAMVIVDRFYKTVKKETVEYSEAEPEEEPEESLLAKKKVVGPLDDAPDAGFDNGEAYTGAQGQSTGILGMMEVMEGDFARTISETEKAEAAAQQEYLKFETDTGIALAEKTTAETERKSQKTSAEDKLTTAEEGLEAQSSKLQSALAELLELKPVCVDTGMTYAERVAAREEEIAALKRAHCILDNYGGGEAATSEC